MGTQGYTWLFVLMVLDDDTRWLLFTLGGSIWPRLFGGLKQWKNVFSIIEPLIRREKSYSLLKHDEKEEELDLI